jgi:hypothetical protein
MAMALAAAIGPQLDASDHNPYVGSLGGPDVLHRAVEGRGSSAFGTTLYSQRTHTPGDRMAAGASRVNFSEQNPDDRGTDRYRAEDNKRMATASVPRGCRDRTPRRLVLDASPIRPGLVPSRGRTPRP